MKLNVFVMKIIILGVGNVGSYLVLMFYQAGYSILQVYSWWFFKVWMLVEQVGVVFIYQLSVVSFESEFCLLVVKDDVIGLVA